LAYLTSKTWVTELRTFWIRRRCRLIIAQQPSCRVDWFGSSIEGLSKIFFVNVNMFRDVSH
jgi:hypothetical protein